MKNEDVRLIIIEVLQDSLTNKIKPECNISPQLISDAILTKIEFEKSYDEILNKLFISSSINKVAGLKDEMLVELHSLTDDEKLLKNFVRGKITAYCEILDVLNNLK